LSVKAGSPVQSQNLIPNGSFEQFLACPSGQDEVSLAAPWNGAGGGSDLFSTCHVNGSNPGCGEVGVPENFAGHSPSYQGSTYAGIVTHGPTGGERTYIQTPLQNALDNDSLYFLTAHIRRSSNSAYATNNIGFVFSTSALNQNGTSPILIPPQLENKSTVADTGSWTTFNSYYIATGTESFLTIGNFRTDNQTDIFQFTNPPATCLDMNNQAYYYIDDLSLEKITESFILIGDTSICTGETTTLSMATNTEGYWSELGFPNDTLAGGAPTLTITPAASTVLVWHGITRDVEVNIIVSDPPTFSLGADTTICSNDTITLEVATEGLIYQWSTGDTTSSIQVSSTGNYIVTVTDAGCSVIDSILIDTLHVPDIKLTTDPVFCGGTDVVILDAGTASSYAWSPGGETTQSITVETEGIYSVYLVLANGCDDLQTIIVTEVCEDLIFIPSAFTPNDDGRNDILYAIGSDVSRFRMNIYNRWGQQVYSSDDRQQGWDGRLNGKPCSSGTYVYVVEFAGIGSDGRERLYQRTGTITLIR
jgi:gliding motility-associated-like protein